MLLIATRVVEIDLPVLDDGVVPIGHVNRTVGAHRNVHRPERDVIRPENVFHLPGGIAAALLFQHKTVYPVGSEIVGDQAILPRFGQVATGNDIEPAVLGLSRIETPQDPLGPWCGDEGSPRERVVDAFVPGPIS